jgi:polyisoprenoid-binding protein YceI
MITFFKSHSKTLLTALTLAIAIPVFAAALQVDNSKSSVNIVFKQMNVPVNAKFTKFTASIDYNSTKPELSKAAVIIDLASFDLGDAEYNKEVLKPEWFNTAKFPQASFTSTTMKAATNGGLVVTGNLSIKGKTVATTFPLSIQKEGSKLVFEGSIPIKRLAFGIGDGEWKDTDMVANEVNIKFKVVATQ